MFLKLLLIILIVYWGGKLVINLLNPPKHHNDIKGNSRKNKPIDLSKYDVEDADFEEIDE